MNNDNKADINIKTKKTITLFEENLEYIDTTEIELLTNKINQLGFNSSFNSSKTSDSGSLILNIDYIPKYHGSFKNSLNKLLQKKKYNEINNLYEAILNEIKKIYYGYTHVEQKMYSKMNKFIKFKNAENNTPMEIISKLKEIDDTLIETIKFVEIYLYLNFDILKKIYQKVDEKLSSKVPVKSLSLYYLLNIFDLPNNELSYILMFKIIDEVSCILRYITYELDNSLMSKDKNESKKDIQNNLLDANSPSPSVAFNAMVKVKDKYIKSINANLEKLDAYPHFRAKYYNKYLYIRGNYQVDSNRYLYDINNDEDDNMSEIYLPINTLMDEEVIIKKFLSEDLINEFLNYLHKHLPISFKRSELLIYIHSIQYNIICIISIFHFSNYYKGFIELFTFYIGKCSSKLIFNYLIKKRFRMKTLLLLSNIILIIGLIILCLDNFEKYYIFLNIISKLLIGFSFCKNIETKFILNYVPKLLINRSIKKYFRIKYLSLSFGFFLLTGLSFLQNIIDNKNIKIDMIIFTVISGIILFLNLIFFNEPKIDLATRSESENLNESNPDEKNEEKSVNSFDSSNLNITNKIMNISYGKAKLISFKERNKVKLLEKSLKSGVDKANYEGTNQIFSILQKLIFNENLISSSYTNISIKGHIIFFIILNIIFPIIIFSDSLINMINIQDYEDNDIMENMIREFKNKSWLFGIPYLLCYIIFISKFFHLKKKLAHWNLILLFFISFLIVINLLFLLLDSTFISNSPLTFNNYFNLGIYSFILFLSLLIERACLKIMIREMPMEKNICSINIDNFLDLLDIIVKALTIAILFFVNYYNVIKHDYIFKIVLIGLYVVELVFFLIFNYKRKQIALIKIINKITYESF